jgi:hypothetical protein
MRGDISCALIEEKEMSTRRTWSSTNASDVYSDAISVSSVGRSLAKGDVAGSRKMVVEDQSDERVDGGPP